FNEETQRHFILASAIPSNTESSLSVRLDFPRLIPYIKNDAIITGTGNIYRICPGKVTMKDCQRVYRLEKRAFDECQNLVRNEKSSILFAKRKIRPRSTVKLLAEVRERNKSPGGIRCFNSLQNANEPSLSKLPRDCLDEKVRDLLYGRKLKLTGDHGCNDLGVEAELSLNADIPLTVDLDSLHSMFVDERSYHFFTTDGMQILHLRSTVKKGINKKTEWIAEREGMQGSIKISEVLDNSKTGKASRRGFFPFQTIYMRYQVCPFMKNLSLSRNV
ncbi:hypothetical protein GcM3_023032, partial [Golovinomyces cichoracearum]